MWTILVELNIWTWTQVHKKMLFPKCMSLNVLFFGILMNRQQTKLKGAWKSKSLEIFNKIFACCTVAYATCGKHYFSPEPHINILNSILTLSELFSKRLYWQLTKKIIISHLRTNMKSKEFRRQSTFLSFMGFPFLKEAC